jgi:hypothetical protein
MPQRERVDVIAIEWDGPFGYDDIKDGKHLNSKDGQHLEDRGVYQIYCNQNEPHTLMYIGQTRSGFKGRIDAKQDWLYWESYEPEIFLGRLRNVEEQSEYEMLLDRTERLLIYYCSLPVNAHRKMASWDAVSNEPSTVLINYKKRFRLPYVVSNLADKQNVWECIAPQAAVGKTLERMEDDNPAQQLQP